MSDTSQSYLYGVRRRVIDEVSSRLGAPAMARARGDFEQRRGRVFEDEELWEGVSELFAETFVFEASQGEPPALLALPTLVTVRERDALRALVSGHRSLFSMTATGQGSVEVLDIIGGAEFSVREPRELIGVGTGDVFETRLLGFEGQVLFAPTFFYHPPGLGDVMVAAVQRLRTAGSTRWQIMDKCAELRIRCERYRHVSPERVYGEAGMR